LQIKLQELAKFLVRFPGYATYVNRENHYRYVQYLSDTRHI